MSLALFALSCAKELEQPKEEASKEETPSQELTSMTFTLAADDDASKTALGEDGKSVHFNTGDEISLFDGEGNRKFVANVHDDGSVSFLGEAADIETAQYKALYPYNEGASVNEGAVKGFCIPAEQTAVKGSFDPKANVSVAYAYEKEGVKYLRFVNVASLAKVVVPATDYKGSTINYAKITLQGNNHYNDGTKAYDIPNNKVIAGGSLSVKTDIVEEKETTIYDIPTEGNKVITLNGPITEGTYYIALYPAQFSDDQGFVLRAYDSKDNIVAFKNTYKANKFNIAKIKNLGTLNPTIPIPEPLDGVFSISKTKVVRFAPGNLQYQASTGNWKFAEEQYIALGAKEEFGNQTEMLLNTDGEPTGSHDGQISRMDQDKWIDLYCFGCTGDATITKMGRGYMPWESWVDDGSRKYYWYGGELSIATHTDWGYVVTGAEENPWLTLSEAEWKYVIGESSDGYTHKHGGRAADGICEHTCLYIRIDTGSEKIKGLLLLPDSWTWPEAAGREPVEYYDCSYGNYIKPDGTLGTASTGVQLYYPVAPNGRDEDSAYTMEQYEALIAAGGVFLPVTGFRRSIDNTYSNYKGTLVKLPADLGCYWSRTNQNDSYASALGFYPAGDFTVAEGKDFNSPRGPRCNHHYRANETANYRDQGYAVRLVKSYDKPMSGSINNLKEKDTTDNHFFDED